MPFTKGHPPYFRPPKGNKWGKKFEKGHPSYLTEESKKKISIDVKKRWLHPEYRAKMLLASKKNKGRKLTEEHKQKLSLIQIKKWDKIGRKTKGKDERLKDYKYLGLRRLVLKRDNFSCTTCGVVGGKLEMHHIKEWRNYPELRYELDNVITLCNTCHKLTDNYGTKTIYRNITEQQLKDALCKI